MALERNEVHRPYVEYNDSHFDRGFVNRVSLFSFFNLHFKAVGGQILLFWRHRLVLKATKTTMSLDSKNNLHSPSLSSALPGKVHSLVGGMGQISRHQCSATSLTALRLAACTRGSLAVKTVHPNRRQSLALRIAAGWLKMPLAIQTQQNQQFPNIPTSKNSQDEKTQIN